jgi:hypothetical protein
MHVRKKKFKTNRKMHHHQTRQQLQSSPTRSISSRPRKPVNYDSQSTLDVPAEPPTIQIVSTPPPPPLPTSQRPSITSSTHAHDLPSLKNVQPSQRSSTASNLTVWGGSDQTISARTTTATLTTTINTTKRPPFHSASTSSVHSTVSSHTLNPSGTQSFASAASQPLATTANDTWKGKPLFFV